jgi:hypothetical protein
MKQLWRRGGGSSALYGMSGRLDTRSSTVLGRSFWTRSAGWDGDDLVTVMPPEIYEEVCRSGQLGRPGERGGIWVGRYSQIRDCRTRADYQSRLGVRWREDLRSVYIVRIVEPEAHHRVKPTGQEQGANDLFGRTGTEEWFIPHQIPRSTGYMPSPQDDMVYFHNIEAKEVELK